MAKKVRRDKREAQLAGISKSNEGQMIEGRKEAADSSDPSNEDRKKKKEKQEGDYAYDVKNKRQCRSNIDADQKNRRNANYQGRELKDHVRKAGQISEQGHGNDHNYGSDQGNNRAKKSVNHQQEDQEGISFPKYKHLDDSSSDEERKRKKIPNERWKKMKQMHKQKKVERKQNDEKEKLEAEVRRLMEIVASLMVAKTDQKPNPENKRESGNGKEGFIPVKVKEKLKRGNEMEKKHPEPLPNSPDTVNSSKKEQKPVENQKVRDNWKRNKVSLDEGKNNYSSKNETYIERGHQSLGYATDKGFGPRYFQATIPEVNVAGGSLKNADKMKFAEVVDRYTKMPHVNEDALFDVVRQKLGKYATDTWFDPAYANLDKNKRPKSFLEAFKKQWIRVMDHDDYNKLIQGFHFEHLSDAVQMGIHFEEQCCPYLELADCTETRQAAERMKVARFKKIVGGTLMAQILNSHPEPFRTVSEMISAIKELNDHLGITHQAEPSERSFYVMALATNSGESESTTFSEGNDDFDGQGNDHFDDEGNDDFDGQSNDHFGDDGNDDFYGRENDDFYHGQGNENFSGQSNDDFYGQDNDDFNGQGSDDFYSQDADFYGQGNENFHGQSNDDFDGHGNDNYIGQDNNNFNGPDDGDFSSQDSDDFNGIGSYNYGNEAKRN